MGIGTLLGLVRPIATSRRDLLSPISGQTQKESKSDFGADVQNRERYSYQRNSSAKIAREPTTFAGPEIYGLLLARSLRLDDTVDTASLPKYFRRPLGAPCKYPTRIQMIYSRDLRMKGAANGKYSFIMVMAY